MDCIDSKQKCRLFGKLLERLDEFPDYAIDCNNGDGGAMGFNEKCNNLWIIMDAGDYGIGMFINLDDNDEEIKYCWTNSDDGEEHIDEDFNKIYNIAHEYHNDKPVEVDVDSDYEGSIDNSKLDGFMGDYSELD